MPSGDKWGVLLWGHKYKDNPTETHGCMPSCPPLSVSVSLLASFFLSWMDDSLPKVVGGEVPVLRTLMVLCGFSMCLFSMLGKKVAGVPRKGMRRDHSPKWREAFRKLS